MKNISIYIDGSCMNNGFKHGDQKPYGGWAMIVVIDNEVIFEKSDGALFVTNNKMEIESLIQALKWIQEQGNEPDTQYTIYSDSEYVILSTLFYIKKWVVNDWMKVTGDGKIPVKNKDLWEQVYNLFYKELTDFNIKLLKVKAHSNDTFNDIADRLAKSTSEKYKNKHIDEYKKGVIDDLTS